MIKPNKRLTMNVTFPAGVLGGLGGTTLGAEFDGSLSGSATMDRTQLGNFAAHPLWMWIRLSSERVSFKEYNDFVSRVLCTTDPNANNPQCVTEGPLTHGAREINARGVDAYDLLKTATEAFLLLRSGCTCIPFDTGLHTTVVPSLGGTPIQTVPTTSATAGLSGVTRFDGAGMTTHPSQRRNEDGCEPPANPCGCEAETPFGAREDFSSEFVRLEDPKQVPPYASPDDIAARLGEFLRHPNNSYIQTILNANFGPNWREDLEKSPFCGKLWCPKVTCPCLLELIWSYWHEEGMLVQAINAISIRFQNKRFTQGRDPLAELAVDPLRSINNFLWGYIQDEQHRLTVPRRAYEYSHHYGLSLDGRAVPSMRPADNRSKFIEGFHDLLYRAAMFFREDADTTVVSDGFPLLNALKEVHMLLAQGAHNQFGDLPWTARVEMMMQQWILARPEMRDFLGSRVMVPYQEAWMGRVDTMKKLQGWSDVTVTHFRDLGVFGERLLLSIRHGNWSVMTDQEHARTWARYWKPEIQSYIHAYRAVTGADLTSEPVDSALPSVLLRRRLSQQQAAMAR